MSRVFSIFSKFFSDRLRLCCVSSLFNWYLLHPSPRSALCGASVRPLWARCAMGGCSAPCAACRGLWRVWRGCERVRVTRVALRHLRQRVPLLRPCGGRVRVLRGCGCLCPPLRRSVTLWALCVALGASCRRGRCSAPPQPLRLPWLILCPSAVSLVGWRGSGCRWLCLCSSDGERSVTNPAPPYRIAKDYKSVCWHSCQESANIHRFIRFIR